MRDERQQTSESKHLGKPTGQPVRAPVKDLPDRSLVRSRPIQTTNQSVNVRRRRGSGTRNTGEYVKFGMTALILLGTPLVIALLIPFIFGQIVPTILGSNLPANTPAMPGDQVIEPENPQTGIGGEATPAGIPAIQDPTTTEVLVHIVRSGDTLESIAREYGVTSADIAAANNLQDPGPIIVGSVLIIPQPTDPYPYP